jgi:hypothetical protein
VIQSAHEATLSVIEIRHRVERPKFTRLGALAVSDMEHGETIIKMCNRGRHATVHAAAGEDDG